MISAWLDLPVAGIFASLVIFYGLTAAVIAWLAFWSPLSARIHGFIGLSASYFTSVSVLFALLTGFLAGDVIDRNKRAAIAVQTESGALANLNALTIASAADMTTIRQALRGYLDAIVNDEWTQMAHARTSAKSDAALAVLLRTVVDPAIAPAAGQVIQGGLVQLVLSAAAARSDRLALNANQYDDAKWGTVLFLCLMTQFAIGMVHLERSRAQALALTIFTVSAIVVLGLIAIQEDPFDGPLKVSPTPLESVLKTVAG